MLIIFFFYTGETYGAEDPHTGLPVKKKIWHVNHIRFTLQHMKSLGDIPVFSRITILILDHNYLENIESLSSLNNLIKLDLHSNQVSCTMGYLDYTTPVYSYTKL